MKKIYLIILFVFLIGCSGLPSGFKLGGTSPGQVATDVKFRTGTESASITLLQQMPPDPIFILDKFNIGLEIENKGAYTIDQGSVVITGYERIAYKFAVQFQFFKGG